MTILVAVTGLLGAVTGLGADRLARRPDWNEGATNPGRSLGTVVVVAGTAVGFVLVAWRLGASPELPAFLVLLAAGVLLALVDLHCRRLPNQILLPTGVLVTALLTLAAAFDDRWPDVGRGLLAAAICFAVGLVLALLAPAGLGMGDVKLAAVLGLALGWLGWAAVLLAFLLAFVLQAVLAVGLLLARRAGRQTELPFGPALLAGTLLVVLLTGR